MAERKNPGRAERPASEPRDDDMPAADTPAPALPMDHVRTMRRFFAADPELSSAEACEAAAQVVQIGASTALPADDKGALTRTINRRDKSAYRTDGDRVKALDEALAGSHDEDDPGGAVPPIPWDAIFALALELLSRYVRR